MVVMGASEDRGRVAFDAAMRLQSKGYDVVGIGLKAGRVGDMEIMTGKPELNGVDTVTIYINPARQSTIYEYVLGLNPKRIIFNPGAENPEFERLAAKQGIEVVEACTLIMLGTGQFD